MKDNRKTGTLRGIFELGSAILICQCAGIIGSFFTVSSVSTWYTELNKPAFNPPNWIFGPVWITLYTLMGISLFLVWRKRHEDSSAGTALWSS